MPASLSGPLTSASVPGVLKSFVPAADGVVDLSGVTEYDSAALALLLELARRTTAKGGKLRCVGAPAKLVELAGFFEIEEAIDLKGSV